MLLQLIEPAIRNIFPRPLIRLGAPIEIHKVELECPECFAEAFQGLDAGFDDLDADAVARHGRDAISGNLNGFDKRHGDGVEGGEPEGKERKAREDVPRLTILNARVGPRV